MKNTRVGFTVIEMMIVIVIIAILSGFVFRMMTLAGQKNSSAETKALLEKIANAIEAYRGEYGSYPPVAVYKCNDGSLIQPTFYEYTYGSGLEALPSQLAAQLMNESRKKNLWDEYPVFTFGLASYLYPRTPSEELLSMHNPPRQSLLRSSCRPAPAPAAGSPPSSPSPPAPCP